MDPALELGDAAVIDSLWYHHISHFCGHLYSAALNASLHLPILETVFPISALWYRCAFCHPAQTVSHAPNHLPIPNNSNFTMNLLFVSCVLFSLPPHKSGFDSSVPCSLPWPPDWFSCMQNYSLLIYPFHCLQINLPKTQIRVYDLFI